MRVFSAAAFGFVVASAAPVAQLSSELPVTRGIEVLEYSAEKSYARFAVPCTAGGCFEEVPGADDSLVIDLEVQPDPSIDLPHFSLAGQIFTLPSRRRPSTIQRHAISVLDLNGEPHGCGVEAYYHEFVDRNRGSVVQALPDIVNVSLVCAQLSSIDLRIDIDFTASQHLLGISKLDDEHDFEMYHDSYSSTDSLVDAQRTDECEHDDKDVFNVATELETLRLLETQARALNNQISEKKKAIAKVLTREQDQMCLKHLIKECDGVVSAAKAVLRRICDRVGIKTSPSFGLAGMRQQQKMMALYSDDKHIVSNLTDEKTYAAEAVTMPLILTKNETQSFPGLDLANTSNPVLRAMQIIATVLGLTALLMFIRNRCMSARKRVERRADIEERRSARAYRRAARRALVRKRWDNFVSAINCFKCREESRIDDYEEKRALILQDAFLEQMSDLESAEKGEVMEAEIRELRYAHEIVSSLVRVDEHRYELVTPIHDPPPPLIPLPYTPVDTRSRANSSYTLPSYFSESLPDYSSQPEDTTTASSVVNGLASSTSEGRSHQTPMSPLSEYSHVSRFTPSSSVLEMSTRASEETIRTRQSRETPCP